jgi:hypothetical protein
MCRYVSSVFRAANHHWTVCGSFVLLLAWLWCMWWSFVVSHLLFVSLVGCWLAVGLLLYLIMFSLLSGCACDGTVDKPSAACLPQQEGWFRRCGAARAQLVCARRDHQTGDPLQQQRLQADRATCAHPSRATSAEEGRAHGLLGRPGRQGEQFSGVSRPAGGQEHFFANPRGCTALLPGQSHQHRIHGTLFAVHLGSVWLFFFFFPFCFAFFFFC